MHIGERNNKLVIKMWMALLLFVSGSACTSLQTNKMEQVKKLTEKARYLGTQGRHQEALAEQQKALELDLTNAESLFTMAGIYGELGNVEKERDYLKEGLKYEPNKAVFNDLLCWAEVRMNNYSEAVKYGEIAVKLEPNNENFWNTLGLAKNSANDFQGAEEAYKKGLAIKPDDDVLLLNYGILKKRKGEYNQALAMFYKVLDYETSHNKDAARIEKLNKFVEEIRQAQEAEKLKSVTK